MAAAGVHVIMLPYPPAGHSTPFIHFAKGLARLGVAITIIVPDSGLSRFQKQLTEDPTFEARSNIHLVPFEFPVADLDPLHPLKKWMYSKSDMFSDIVGGLMTDAAESPMMVQYPSRSEAGPPVCILSDMFLGFTQNIADKYKIPRYCLFTCPANFLSFVYHLRQFHAEGRIPIGWEDEPLRIANFPPIGPGDAPPSQHAASAIPNSHLFLRDETDAMFRAAGVLVNSIYELESEVIEGLKQYLAQASPDQVPILLTIGPLFEGFFEGSDQTLTFRERLQANKHHQSDPWFEWLDQQPNASVLYICFGSIVELTGTQIKELALGLEKSGQRFFWVLRESASSSKHHSQESNIKKMNRDLSDILPEGFLERTKSRGIVYVEWVPQLQVLAHPSIGGFLSHCGWNSTFESMCLGVPMVAMPIQSDQMMNAIFIEKTVGVGVRVNAEKGGWAETVGWELIEKAIKTLMNLDANTTGDMIRRKAVQVRETIERAIRSGGSSKESMVLFVKLLRIHKTSMALFSIKSERINSNLSPYHSTIDQL